MAVAKKTYVSVELEFAEKNLESWKKYVNDNPIHKLKDRVEYRSTKTGGMIPMVIASIEQQGKFLQETMKNYLLLLEQVDRLREAEEKKAKEVRGGSPLSPFEEGNI